MTEFTGADIGARLKEARLFLGLTQEQVAGALDLSRSSVSAIEHGQRGVSGLELRRFARLYRRPVAWLLGEDIEPDPEILAATQRLSQTDRSAVLRFAEFLASAGPAPEVRRP